MKALYLALSGLFLILGLSVAKPPIAIDLKKAAQEKQMTVYNRSVTLIDEPNYPGVRLSKATGEGIAWIDGIDFSNGVITLDVRGENLKQHSFVGIAFHGQDDESFDAVYLRPFQFPEADETLRRRAIQYISLPQFTWRKLREMAPGAYENTIVPMPRPEDWINMKIVVEGDTVSTFINGSDAASLVVQKMGGHKRGKIGLYVADTSGGDFANLSIVQKD